MDGLGLVTHSIAWFPIFAQALISPSVPAVCNEFGPSTATACYIMQLLFPEIQRHTGI